MLVSVWIYAYSEGISAAREIERLMEYEPGLVWLCGGDAVNHHTLSDFRVDHQEATDKLFQNLLAVLNGRGLIDLSQVMHDGTKVRANRENWGSLAGCAHPCPSADCGHWLWPGQLGERPARQC